MKAVKVTLPRDFTGIKIHTLADWHIGDNACDLTTIKDQIQAIKDSGTTGTTKMVYIDGKEITIIYDGTVKIRRSENGIDFETIKKAKGYNWLDRLRIALIKIK